MTFKVVIEKTSEGSVEGFWRAIEIYLRNQHVVNKKISSGVTLLVAELDCDTIDLFDRLSQTLKIESSEDNDNFIENIKTALLLNNKCNFLAQNFELLKGESKSSYFLVHKHLPRNATKFSSGLQFTIIDKISRSISQFYQNLDNEKRCLGLNEPWKIAFNNDNVFSISVKSSEIDSSDPRIIWLRDKLSFYLLKWMQQQPLIENSLVSGSLNLVSSEKYSILYDKLKKKYGQEMVKKWSECTDPNKFVYEDIAIATYLILLWEQECTHDEKKQSFVDLGCGNGLLVHILTSEGYPGIGIDLRKRKIWDIYPPEIHLEERTIVPSSSSLFPEADWIIGNHSDELTPWIPVIAARSSYNCRFFLLPCCAHEFDGRKFQRYIARESVYSQYLRYVKSVSESCGFKTDMDKLKIPSTKKICLIGRERTYAKDEFHIQDEIIEATINERSVKSKKVSTDQKMTTDDQINKEDDSKWSKDFQPRESVERVRNCTKLDKSIIHEIVSEVSTLLLSKKRNIITTTEQGIWNAGGQIELSELAKILSPDMMKAMKNECGGLQTLLKNNSHIFQVVQGKVQFRIPGTKSDSTKRRKGKKNPPIKTRLCWFYENHPDGCPLSDENCNFRHDSVPETS